MLLWLRWGMLDRPRRRWYSPLPSWLLTPMVIVAFFALNFVGINFARSAAVDAASGCVVADARLPCGRVDRRCGSRPMLIRGTADVAPQAPQAP
jgi:hypothetical protein